MFNNKNIMDEKSIKNLVNSLKKLNLHNDFDEDNIFSVCGFPHYENVVSNVFAYFLRKETFGEIILKSLFQCLNLNFNGEHVLNVLREATTDDGARIDLIIETENYVIAIENKIYADDENQPYDLYQKYLNVKYLKKYNENNKKLVLLSMYQKETKSKYKGIECILYRDLIKNIENNINTFELAESKNLKDLLLFKDFINNLKNIMNYEDLNKKEYRELLANSGLLVSAIKEMNKYRESILSQFEESIKNNFDIVSDGSWIYPIRGIDNYIECTENNLVLADFIEYAPITLSLWLQTEDNDKYSLSISLLKSKLDEKKCKVLKTTSEDKYWYNFIMKEYNYSDGVDVNKLVKDTKEMVEKFRNNINQYITKE